WNVNGPFSVEFWAKPAQTNSAVCPAASVTYLPGFGTRSGWLFYQTSSNFGEGNGWYFRLSTLENDLSVTNVFVDMPLSTNSWYHVVASFSGTNVSLYVNGTLAASVPFNGGYRPVTDPSA